eukprot:scaffold227240_cov32-Tisochrysis_lutea.AAC.3
MRRLALQGACVERDGLISVAPPVLYRTICLQYIRITRLVLEALLQRLDRLVHFALPLTQSREREPPPPVPRVDLHTAPVGLPRAGRVSLARERAAAKDE